VQGFIRGGVLGERKDSKERCSVNATGTRRMRGGSAVGEGDSVNQWKRGSPVKAAKVTKKKTCEVDTCVKAWQDGGRGGRGRESTGS